MGKVPGSHENGVGYARVPGCVVVLDFLTLPHIFHVPDCFLTRNLSSVHQLLSSSYLSSSTGGARGITHFSLQTYVGGVRTGAESFFFELVEQSWLWYSTHRRLPVAANVRYM
ncbi:uncharacterized protein G2W53_009387 [Senna tora]|uniref:Uncharacterized protein n=1 Tax=Senna tora TaxID=362788 RepID=A0A834WYA4_9FABA|nr:uncharacterized protein G2W53_009387 [Senna tora]